MNYNKLKYFYHVSQTLNFTKSAVELYVSQSAISRHMKELEQDFGVELFIRTNRDLILTESGRILAEEIRPFFSRENEIYQKVRAASLKNIWKLNIGFMGIKYAYHIPAITNEMLQEYPAISVNLRRYNWDDILPALNAHEIDVGLRLRMGTLDETLYESFTLDVAHPSIVVSSRHPMAYAKQATLRDFKDDTFLLLSQKDSGIPHTHTKELFQRFSFLPKKYAEYDQVETILMLIHSDAGVSLLSRFAATDQFSDLHIVDIADIAPLYLELVWKRENSNPFIQPFAEKLAAYCRCEL